jgi:hypothetical protein
VRRCVPDEITAGERVFVQIGRNAPVIKGLEPMVFKIFQKRLPDGFGFARDDGVAVELRLVGQDGGMDAPQNDGFSPFLETRRDSYSCGPSAVCT